MFCFAATGCATLPPANPQQALRQRVEKLMQAKIDNHWGVVYNLYDAKFRDKNPRQKFLQYRRNMKFGKYTIESIDIAPNGTKAKVRVRSDVSMMGYHFKGAVDNQTWVRQGRQWYLKVPPYRSPMGVPAKKKG